MLKNEIMNGNNMDEKGRKRRKKDRKKWKTLPNPRFFSFGNKIRLKYTI